MKRMGHITRHFARHMALLLAALLVLAAWLPAAALADGEGGVAPPPAGQSSAQDSAAAGGQDGQQQGDGAAGNTATPVPANTATPKTPVVTIQVDTPAPDTPAPVPSSLRIDSQNLYDGMAATYAQGYAPTVSGGKATIILPLLCSGKLAGDSLVATPNLGSTLDSPFVFGNYQQIVPLSTQSVNGGKGQVQAYYVRFDLALSSARINGVYPVVITVEAFDTAGNELRGEFTTYVTISDGQDPPKETVSTGSSGPTASKPVLVVTACDLSKTTLQVGDTLQVNLTADNLGRRTANNIRATIVSDDANIVLLNDFSAQYERALASGDSTSFSFELQVLPLAMGGMHTMTIQLNYEGPDNSGYTENAVFRCMVEQKAALEYDVVKLPESATSGDSFSIPVSAYNPGTATVYNVRFTLHVDGLIAATAYLGNLAPEESADKMMEIFATTLSGTEKYGQTYGMCELRYEDAMGQEYWESIDLTMNLLEPVKITDVEKEKLEEEAKEQETLSQWWVSLLFGIAIIAVLVAVIIVGKFSRMMKLR